VHFLWVELVRQRPLDAPDKLYLVCNSQGIRKAGTFKYVKGFKRQPLGKNILTKLLPDICVRAGIPPRSAHAMRRTAICDMFAADIHVSFLYLLNFANHLFFISCCSFLLNFLFCHL
jgi:integrase